MYPISLFLSICNTCFLFQEPHHLSTRIVQGFLKISASLQLLLYCGQCIILLKYLPPTFVHFLSDSLYSVLKYLHFQERIIFLSLICVFALTGLSRYNLMSSPVESFFWPQSALINPWPPTVLLSHLRSLLPCRLSMSFEAMHTCPRNTFSICQILKN